MFQRATAISSQVTVRPTVIQTVTSEMDSTAPHLRIYTAAAPDTTNNAALTPARTYQEYIRTSGTALNPHGSSTSTPTGVLRNLIRRTINLLGERT